MAAEASGAGESPEPFGVLARHMTERTADSLDEGRAALAFALAACADEG